MNFTVNGTRTTIMITTVVEKIEDGEVTLGKQTVREATGCPSSEDGDSSIWYDYAAEALDNGAQHKLQKDFGKITVISDQTKIKTSWDGDLEVDF
tara:strand:- start:1373 stop:1657 length:285 start_codon:yes stop_codon:yes gene_type:complete